MIPSLAASTVPWNRPWTESYFRRWARVAGSVMSLIETTSIPGFWARIRKTFRPMRPKPLMAMRMRVALGGSVSRGIGPGD